MTSDIYVLIEHLQGQVSDKLKAVTVFVLCQLVICNTTFAVGGGNPGRRVYL